MSKIEWDKLKTFYYVAKHKSFTHSANYLHLSQSALSRQVAKLEDQVGQPLFHRHQKGLILTDAGEHIYKLSQKVISEVEFTQAKIFEDESEATGTLKITTTNALSALWLAKFTPEFLSKHPGIRLTIIGDDKELDLSIRQADAAIRPFVESRLDLEQEYLTTFHLGMYASKEYLEKFGTPECPQDLDNHQLLIFGDYSIHPYGNINWLLKFGANVDKPREPYMCINSAHGLMSSAQAGMGIAALSQEYAEEVSDLVRILKDYETPDIKLYYVYPKEMKNSKRITSFCNFLKEKLQ